MNIQLNCAGYLVQRERTGECTRTYSTLCLLSKGVLLGVLNVGRNSSYKNDSKRIRRAILDCFFSSSDMRTRHTASAVGNNKTASNATHVLIQTNEDLVLGTLSQVEHHGKENLNIGVTTTLINGRKRTRGTVICLGTAAQCEQTRKTISHSFSNSATKPVIPSGSVCGSPENSRSLIKRNQQLPNRTTTATIPSSKSKVVHDRQQDIRSRSPSNSAELRKIHRAALKTRTTEELAEKADLDTYQQLVAQLSTRKESKRPNFEQKKRVLPKATPLRSPVTSTPMAAAASSVTTEGIESYSDETDGEEEVEAAQFIDEDYSTNELIQEQRKTNKRKGFEEEQVVEAKRHYINKSSNQGVRIDLNSTVRTTNMVKKRKQSGPTVASLTRQTEILKDQLEANQRETFALPTGDAAAFILNLADKLRSKGAHGGLIDAEEAESIGERLANISDLLGVSDADLETTRHLTDITKTARQVTKLVYPDVAERQKMRISTMDKKIMQAIIDYARISHPFASNNVDLRGHIGNVFASDRKKLIDRGEAHWPTDLGDGNAFTDEELNEDNEDDD
ncbi:unnamed protein product [Adineta ricciae]|uniref:Uncharacterized protein n=1 Tax=Adineta ricciae TaxID=249248 RepID=A0A815Z147_ADIRI|nr:unnamed protein product [Adineta ricciae]CAF1577297.1 unnamed protein product [Adineta ricciae]